MLSCESAGGEAAEADPLALSVELLHTFSLVHDDLMDADATRRGVPSVHEAYGDATAILAGDALYALAFEALAQLKDVPDGMEIVGDVAHTARRLCEGQEKDMAFEDAWPSVGEYEAMISRKTASLFACSTRNGARVAGAERETVNALSAFGHSLGMGFQVQDDVLDLTGEAEALGKPVASDIRAGKKTHPILAAHERADEAEQDVLEEILGNEPDDEDVTWVLDLLDETGALAASRKRATELMDGARSRLAGLPATPAQETLEAILDTMIQRDR